jgi:hypothetical protein
MPLFAFVVSLMMITDLYSSRLMFPCDKDISTFYFCWGQRGLRTRSKN